MLKQGRRPIETPKDASLQGQEKIQVSFPADKKYLSLIGAIVQEVCGHVPGLPISSSYNVELAVNEAVVNVIAHAYRDDPSQIVQLDFHICPDRLIIRVRDWGLSFDPASIPEPDFSYPQESGYGVYLIRQLMDDVSYEPGTVDGNCVTLVKLAE